MIHHAKAVRRLAAGTLALYAVSELASSMALSITGNRHAAVAASIPVRNAHDPRNAVRSRRPLKPSPTATSPAKATSTESHASGRDGNAANRFALTNQVVAVISGHESATALYSQSAARRLRD